MKKIVPPLAGIGRRLAHQDSKQLPMSDYMSNVRPIDTQEKRLRLGQRPGLDKWASGDNIGGGPVVFITAVNSLE